MLIESVHPVRRRPAAVPERISSRMSAEGWRSRQVACFSRGRRLDLLLGLHVNIGGAAALITFRSNDLVVVLPKIHAMRSPGVEVVLHVDSASDALGGADGPVLLKGLGSVNGGLIRASRDVDVIGPAVGRDGALVLPPAAGVVGTVGLNDVVLDQGAPCPAIDGQVSVATRAERAAVVDGPVVKSQASFL